MLNYAILPLHFASASSSVIVDKHDVSRVVLSGFVLNRASTFDERERIMTVKGKICVRNDGTGDPSRSPRRFSKPNSVDRLTEATDEINFSRRWRRRIVLPDKNTMFHRTLPLKFVLLLFVWFVCFFLFFFSERNFPIFCPSC